MGLGCGMYVVHVFLDGFSPHLLFEDSLWTPFFVELALPGPLPPAYAKRHTFGPETSLAVLGPVRAAGQAPLSSVRLSQDR